MDEDLECEQCNEPFEEGQTVYVYSIGEWENYFCSKACLHDWIDEDLDSCIYHRDDFADLLD